jgi:hypothetical protein
VSTAVHPAEARELRRVRVEGGGTAFKSPRVIAAMVERAMQKCTVWEWTVHTIECKPDHLDLVVGCGPISADALLARGRELAREMLKIGGDDGVVATTTILGDGGALPVAKPEVGS